MSLIVQALKRAQEGATRRLPPLSGYQTRGPFPGQMGSPDDDRRRRSAMMLISLGIGVTAVVGAGLWFAGGSMTRAPMAKTPPQLVVVEPVAGSAPAAAKSASEAGTSIEEVRAALLAAQPLETVVPLGKETAAAVENDVAERPVPPPPSAQTPTRSTKPAENRGWSARPVPPRADTVVPTRAEATTSPIDVPISRPSPQLPPPPAIPAVREAGAIVKVHPEPAKEGTDALAAGLKDQQGGQTAKAIDEYRRESARMRETQGCTTTSASRSGTAVASTRRSRRSSPR